ncbi:hypothetical protein IIV25_130L [Invertebrate iridovirus 25]|uniref:Uncharacterized protein n=1 Tax=Invertebrate iridovirus 25 TaxID=1301280 RepID=W8W1L7_9VIRU|nr:hypothetical protein IIV25_130L [Invertebrate iridovirus 25]CCV02148.1 hypothetical protein IIV25_130L [Invertebrate iridovirus 25]
MTEFKIDNPAVLYLSGGTMVGVINQPNLPINPLELTNKEYVDNLIASGVPDATNLLKGKLRLSGDLAGTANTPLVAPLAITNAKLANMTTPSQLKGSNSVNSAVTDIFLGSNLIMIGSTLNIDTSSMPFLPLSGGVMSGAISQPITPVGSNDLTNKAYVDSQITSITVPDATTTVKGKIQLAGDLSGTAATPVISPLAVTSTKIANGAVLNTKLANLSGVSQLKGSSSASSTATDISLGSNLSMVGSTLNVNTASLGGTFLPLSGGTMSGAISQPLAPSAPSELTNKMYVDTFFVPDATTTAKGKIQLSGDLTGTASAPQIANLAITNSKIATNTILNSNLIAMSGTSQLKGSSSTSSAVTDISLGSNLNMTGSTLNVNTSSLSGTFLPLAGGTMSGAISQPLAPVAANDLVNKMYVDTQIFNNLTPDASTSIKGKIQLAGDLGGVGTTAATPIISTGSITNLKLANFSGVSQLKGSSSASSTATDISLGSNLSITGSTLNVNTASLSGTFLPLAGGTMSGAISQPLAPSALNDLTNKAYVDSLTTPDATTSIKGKIQLSGDLGGVGTTATTPIISNLAITTGKLNDNSVTNLKLANFSGVSQLKGSSSASSTATDISLGSNLSITGSTLNVNTASLSGTFLPLSGGTMSGAISQPLAPVAANDLTNKAYVDAQIVSGTPDATTSVKGKIQLSGDLGGVGTTATAPIISNLAITNPKINPGGASTLKGTNSLTNIDDITLGSGLQLSVGASPTLSVNSATLQKAGNTQFGVVEFDPTGDLNATATNSGIGVVKPLAITNPKINPGGVSTLKGTNSLVAIDDITLGSGLQLSVGISPTLSVNPTTIQKAGATQFGVVEFDPSGDLAATAPNSGIGVIKPLAITNPKINPGGASTLKGTNSLVAIDDITLGSGLQLSVGASPTLSVNLTSLQKAGNTQFGVVEFDPTGDLTQTALNSGIGVVKPLAITNAKLANLSGISQLKGSGSGGPAVVDITLGSGLVMLGTNLFVDNSALQKAGATQFGVVEFDPSGDLAATSANSGIGVVKSLAITNAKLANLSGVSQLKGSTSASSAATDITLGSGLTMTSSTLSVDQTTFNKAGNTQFGVVEFDPTGDLTQTATNSGIGVVKAVAITNPKINPGGASTLKGTNSLSNVDDITLGSGLQLSVGVSPTLSVDQTTFNKAGNSQFGVVEFDPTGDLTQTAVNSGIGVVKAVAITNPKINPGGASTLKGTNSLSNVDDITLGSGLQLTTGTSPILSVQKAGATQFGVVEFDPSGDLNATAANSGIGVVKTGAITNAKLANLGAVSQLKGSSSASSAATDITLGSGLTMTSSTLSVDQTTFNKAGNTQFGVVEFDPTGDLTQTATNSGIGVVKAVAITNPKINPGGASTLKGTNSLINIDDITLGSGLQLTTGVSPTLSVNSTTLQKAGNTQFGVVEFDPTGDLTQTVTNSGIGVVKPLAITNAKLANLSAVSQLKGSSSASSAATDITLGSSLVMTGSTISVDQTTFNKAGNTQFGVVEFDPSGDLNATAANSGIGVVKPLAITNAKLANLSATSQLKGSSSASSAATDITLGSSLVMTGSTISVDQTTFNKAGNTQFGVIEFDPTGDLTQTAANSGIGVVKAVAITNPKINPGGSSTLKGTNSLTNIDDITLGSGLQLSVGASPTLSVNSATLQKAGNTQFGVVEFDPTGDLNATATNSGIGVVKTGAITNAKLANLSAVSQLKGSSSASSAATDITLGSGLTMASSTLSVDQTTFNKAGATQFGVVEFDPSGDLNATAANSGIGVVKPLAITNAKLANLSAVSQLKGSSSASSAATDITLGSGLTMTSSTLSVDQTTFNKAGATQFGVVEFDPSGDLNATAANSGIGVVKAVAITNPKINPGGASTLKGTNSLTNVDDITLGSGLQLTTGAGPTLSVTGIKTKNSNVARTLQTSTGAVGFQVSATQPSTVYYSVQISTTIAVGGSSTGTVFLEVAPTNSAVAGDWVIDAQISNNQSFAGLLTLSSTQVMCFELSTYVPVGYYVKLRTTTSGTASFVYQRGTEVLG